MSSLCARNSMLQAVTCVALALATLLPDVAVALTPAEKDLLVERDPLRPGAPSSTSGKLASRLGSEGDLQALQFVLERADTTLVHYFLARFIERHAPRTPLEADFVALMARYYANPEVAREFVEIWRWNSPEFTYDSKQFFDALLNDLTDNSLRPERPKADYVAEAIVHTDRADIEMPLLNKLRGFAPPAPDGPDGTRKPAAPARIPQTALTIEGWSRLIKFFVQRRYEPAIAAMRHWQEGRPANDKLALAIDKAFVTYQTPEAYRALRDRLVEIDSTKSTPEGLLEIQRIGDAMAQIKGTQATGYEQIRDLLPPQLLTSNAIPWAHLRHHAEFQPEAHALIATIVAHYRGLTTYSDAGTMTMYSAHRPGEINYVVSFKSYYERDGRYLIETVDFGGRHGIAWGRPGCQNSYASEGYRYTACTHEDRLPPSASLLGANSIGIQVIAKGPELFYGTGYAYKVERVSASDPDAVRLTGVGRFSGTGELVLTQSETYVVDAGIGRILALETTDLDRRIVHEFTAKENAEIPAMAFRPLRAYIGRFSPLRPLSIEGFAGMLVTATCIGMALAGTVRKLRLTRGGLWETLDRRRILVVGTKTVLGLLAAIALMWYPAQVFATAAFVVIFGIQAVAAVLGLTLGNWLLWPADDALSNQPNLHR